MTRMTVKQVTFMAHGALVAGEPVDDATKVIIAAMDALDALPLAMAVSSGFVPEYEPLDADIVEVLEKPKGV